MNKNFIECLTKRLNELDRNEINILFNGYDASSIKMYSDIECNNEIHCELILSQDMTYDVDEVRQKSVYRFTSLDNDEVMVMFHGVCRSYTGEHYQGWKFVHPVEKTITVYEAGIA